MTRFNVEEIREYEVRFGTGAGDYTKTISLNEFTSEVDENVSYTQSDVVIIDVATNKIAALRKWYGVQADQEVLDEFGDEIIDFQKFGYYEPWKFNEEEIKHYNQME